MSQPQIERPELKKRLPYIHSLAMLKMEKNFIAVIEKKYPRQPYASLTIDFLFERLEQEKNELKEALKTNNTDKIREECADVSNIIDYIFEIVSHI